MQSTRRRSIMRQRQLAFTLLEILLVVAGIAILAGIVIVALNPGKQLGEIKNAQRKSDVNTILNAVYQYSIDNTGSIPTAIGTSATCDATVTAAQICKTGGVCTGISDMAVLTTNGKYLVSMPSDPTGATTNGTGYFIVKDANGRVTVCAPSAEQGATISATR